MAPYPEMWAYVDESQAARATSTFVATIWFTAYKDMWQSIIRDVRNDERFGYEMHFHKISSNPNDWRFRVTNRAVGKLLQYDRSWYARSVYVPEEMIRAWAALANRLAKAKGSRIKVWEWPF